MKDYPPPWKNKTKLEALRERRPPWPRQIITLILPTVKFLSLGCERLPTPLKKKKFKKKKKKKVLDHYLHHDLGVLPLLRCFFAHLLILQYPDHHQNLISSSLYYSGPVHKISSQSVHNCLSNVVQDKQTNKQTDRQTDKLTNATKNITSFAKGGCVFVSIGLSVYLFLCEHYSKSYEWIGMKFYGKDLWDTIKKWLNFGGYLSLLRWVNEQNTP